MACSTSSEAGAGIGEARTPDDGMDAIPRALAAAFAEAGGTIRCATSSSDTTSWMECTS